MTSVLIIDDNPEDREQFSYLLELAQPTVKAVARNGGEDGLTTAAHQPFDCVLLDLRLEGESGLDVLSQFQEVHPKLPVIVFTGQGSEQAATDAFVAGAAYYLPKRDLTAKALWTAVERVVSQAATDRELKSKREALERSNRLDAVGQLAAGIAHDFNNQLGALRYCIELLKDTAVTERSQEQVRTALKVIDESAHLATRMLALSRQGDLMARNVQLRVAFDDLRSLARSSVSDQVMLEVSDPGADLSAVCDPGQLLNALLNLILNANDAIKANGKIGTVAVSAALEADKVHIVVKDNGIGMTDDVLAKCSDPFFTTKTETNGTGLGLAMVQRFANENGGELLIDAAEGAGAEVTLVLSQGNGDSETDKPAEIIRPQSEKAAKILLVEDQFILAQMSKEIIEAKGFTVEIAQDGQAALDVFSNGYQADLVITDIKMPGMNGFELASQIRQKHPATGIIYVTGYADNPAFGKQEMYGPILQKPVEPETLIATIRKLLARDTAE